MIPDEVVYHSFYPVHQPETDTQCSKLIFTGNTQILKLVLHSVDLEIQTYPRRCAITRVLQLTLEFSCYPLYYNASVPPDSVLSSVAMDMGSVQYTCAWFWRHQRAFPLFSLIWQSVCAMDTSLPSEGTDSKGWAETTYILNNVYWHGCRSLKTSVMIMMWQNTWNNKCKSLKHGSRHYLTSSETKNVVMVTHVSY